MSKSQSDLIPRSPFAGLTGNATASSGVVLTDRDGMGIATVLVRKGQTAALALRLREHFGTELPGGPQRVSSQGFALLGTGPGAWLATQDGGGNAFVAALRAAIGDLASISDQSDGLAVLRMSGPRVRDILGSLVPVDVHPKSFRVGDVASTVAAQVAVTLWRVEDCSRGWAVFEIAVSRSLVASFWHELSESAAECGYTFEPIAAASVARSEHTREARALLVERVSI